MAKKDCKTIIYKRLITAIGIDLLLICALFLYIVLFEGVMPYPLLYFLMGSMGGLVSIYQRMDSIEKEKLQIFAGDIFSFLIIPLMGGVFSLILFIMFLANLIAGQFFPSYSIDVGDNSMFYEKIINLRTDFSGFAKSLFWAFLAGFSERFVLNKLKKIQEVDNENDVDAGTGD